VERTGLRPGRTSDPASYPWSHGLLMSTVWATVTAAGASRAYRDRRTGIVLGLVVLSHWVLDFVAHAPDLQLLFDGSGGGDPVTRGAGGQLAAVVWQVKANDGMVAVPHRFRRRLSWVHQHSVRAAGPGQADRVARALAAARRRRLGDRLNTLVRALHLVAGAAILGCAAAIAVALSAPGWWRPLAIVGAAIGLGAFVVFYDGQARLLVVEGAIGAVASLILLVTAIAIPEAFR